MEDAGVNNLLDLGDHRGQLVSDDSLSDQRLAEDLRRRECPSFSQCAKGQGRLQENADLPLRGPDEAL